MSGTGVPVIRIQGISFPAISAEAGNGQGIVGHHKSVADFRGKRDPVQFLTGKIGNLGTDTADKMMMPPGIGVKPGSGLRIADFLGNAELDECFKDPIDGRPGDTRISGSNGLVELVRCRVVAASGKIRQDRPPLEGQGNPLSAASRLKFVEFYFFKPDHGFHEMRYYCNRYFLSSAFWQVLDTSALKTSGHR
jgi:hypothetical protein